MSIKVLKCERWVLKTILNIHNLSVVSCESLPSPLEIIFLKRIALFLSSSEVVAKSMTISRKENVLLSVFIANFERELLCILGMEMIDLCMDVLYKHCDEDARLAELKRLLDLMSKRYNLYILDRKARHDIIISNCIIHDSIKLIGFLAGKQRILSRDVVNIPEVKVGRAYYQFGSLHYLTSLGKLALADYINSWDAGIGRYVNLKDKTIRRFLLDQFLDPLNLIYYKKFILIVKDLIVDVVVALGSSDEKDILGLIKGLFPINFDPDAIPQTRQSMSSSRKYINSTHKLKFTKLVPKGGVDQMTLDILNQWMLSVIDIFTS